MRSLLCDFLTCCRCLQHKDFHPNESRDSTKLPGEPTDLANMRERMTVDHMFNCASTGKAMTCVVISEYGKQISQDIWDMNMPDAWPYNQYVVRPASPPCLFSLPSLLCRCPDCAWLFSPPSLLCRCACLCCLWIPLLFLFSLLLFSTSLRTRLLH